MALHTKAETRRLLGKIGDRTFDKLVAEGVIPQPRMLGPRTPRWTDEDIAVAESRLPRREMATEPQQFAAARLEAKKQAIAAGKASLGTT